MFISAQKSNPLRGSRYNNGSATKAIKLLYLLFEYLIVCFIILWFPKPLWRVDVGNIMYLCRLAFC